MYDSQTSSSCKKVKQMCSFIWCILEGVSSVVQVVQGEGPGCQLAVAVVVEQARGVVPSCARMGPHPGALEVIIVSGGTQEAEVLNGTYEQIGSYEGRPHFSKDGLPYDVPRNGYRENMQIWWHDGEWRIGNTGDHWCARVCRPPAACAFWPPPSL
jgi:hypothetical protein